jgi:ubiquinone/menaquinone biosynthesis C-methylase UbiE
MKPSGPGPSKKDVARQFGRRADAYARSKPHAGGADLELLIQLLKPEPYMSVLDVATGAGHTAIAVAPFVREVTAIDIAPEMVQRTRALAASRGLTSVRAMVMDVETSSFADAAFDAVTCRIAPHHFTDIDRALRSIARMLRRGGPFVMEDGCAPADPDLDRFLNELETIRDPTHVRSYTEAEWRAMLQAASLRVIEARVLRKVRDVADWVERADPGPEGLERFYAALAGAPPEARAYFEIQYDGDRAVRFTDDKLIVRAER